MSILGFEDFCPETFTFDEFIQKLSFDVFTTCTECGYDKGGSAVLGPYAFFSKTAKKLARYAF